MRSTVSHSARERGVFLPRKRVKCDFQSVECGLHAAKTIGLYLSDEISIRNGWGMKCSQQCLIGQLIVTTHDILGDAAQLIGRFCWKAFNNGGSLLLRQWFQHSIGKFTTIESFPRLLRSRYVGCFRMNFVRYHGIIFILLLHLFYSPCQPLPDANLVASNNKG